MRDVKPFLKHILEECAIILEATEGKEFEGFVSDEIPKRAILRSLEVIGEAVEERQKASSTLLSLREGEGNLSGMCRDLPTFLKSFLAASITFSMFLVSVDLLLPIFPVNRA